MLSKVQGTKISRDFLSFTPLQSSGGFRQNKLLATATRSGFPRFHTQIFDFSSLRLSRSSASYRVKEELPELALGPQIAPSATCQTWLYDGFAPIRGPSSPPSGVGADEQGEQLPMRCMQCRGGTARLV